jgi:2,3-bisphosphoglycerate-dependent phosphoglycerate mutase
MSRLILIRHGESIWNRDNRFTGWTDVDLTETGAEQMRAAAAALRKARVTFDLAITSALRRCIRSQWILQDAMDCMWVPILIDWRLNERHYGALTGLRKDEAVQTFGAAEVQRWRRAYDAEPPLGPAGAADSNASDPRYASVPPQRLPRGESLHQTALRVQGAWQEAIAPALRAGRDVVITAHGNSLRALIKQLDGLSEDEVAALEVANATPLVYELDGGLHVQGKQVILAAAATISEIL